MDDKVLNNLANTINTRLDDRMDDKVNNLTKSISTRLVETMNDKVNNLTNKSLKNSINEVINNYLKDPKAIATRKCSEMFLDVASKLPNLIGGSADLAGSTILKLKIIK